MTGLQIARHMAPRGVTVTVEGRDLYDPTSRTIHLCRRTANYSDLMAHACAAHEAAHAVQHLSLRRSFRVWRSWPVQSPWMSLLGIAAAVVAVDQQWHPWPVAWGVVALTLLRLAAVLWIEYEASTIALAWLRLNRLERVGTAAYLRRIGRSYLKLTIGL